MVTAAAALDAGVVKDLDEPTDSPDPYTCGTRTRLTNGSEGCEDATCGRRSSGPATGDREAGVATGVARMRATAEDFGFNDPDVRVPFRVARSTFDTTVDRAQLALSSIGQYNTGDAAADGDGRGGRGERRAGAGAVPGGADHASGRRHGVDGGFASGAAAMDPATAVRMRS
ncbi:hypothetical protein GCM10023238_20050 [Streptomyces heliomycini]